MENRTLNSIRAVAVVVLLLGLAMLAYWSMYILQGMPVRGVPILSEMVNAVLALVSGIGLLRLRKWSIPTSLFTAGMWTYGVLGGIALVLENGLDFSSPFGAITDTILFPLILIFAVFMAAFVWRKRDLFH